MQVRPLLPAPAKAPACPALFRCFFVKEEKLRRRREAGQGSRPPLQHMSFADMREILEKAQPDARRRAKIVDFKTNKKQHDTNKKYGQNRIFVISLPKVDICTSFILKIIRVNPCLYIEYTKEKEAFYEAHFQKVHRTSPDLLHGSGHDPHRDFCRRQRFDADLGRRPWL